MFNTKSRKRKTPEDYAKEKRIAAKEGEKVVPLLADNIGFKTAQEKIESNPSLKEFIDKVS